MIPLYYLKNEGVFAWIFWQKTPSFFFYKNTVFHEILRASYLMQFSVQGLLRQVKPVLLQKTLIERAFFACAASETERYTDLAFD